MLTSTNFFNYARASYDNPTCKTAGEFSHDIRRFNNLSACLKKIGPGPINNIQLIFNHIMILLNVFNREECVVMMFYKVHTKDYPILKTFLVGLSMMPDTIPELGIISSEIPIDERVATFMRNL